MGIIKISETMHANLRVASTAFSRSINAQAEHWLRVGMLSELRPELNHSEICRLLVDAEQTGGFDLGFHSASPARATGQAGQGQAR
jgi:plasmid stability protein